MNLITTPWLNVVRANGDHDIVTPGQLVEIENPILDLAVSRPDFKGGLYQFLIGLFQSFYAPEGNDDWSELYRAPPLIDEVNDRLSEFINYFELFSDSAAFMQDFDLHEGETKSVAVLLIESPGGKTVNDNLDHFIKRDQVNAICPDCLASALFTLQTNAPAGGKGHYTSLRGGGPLTTLLLPENSDASLWQKIWLNILPEQSISDDYIDEYSDVLPWLKAIKTSEQANNITTINDVHPLHMYWSMPRRIRINIDTILKGDCDLCGKHSDELIREYRTKTYGMNYDGEWIHPLTPHKSDPKGKNPTLSIKGKQGGVGYQDWLALNFRQENNNALPAQVVSAFYAEKLVTLKSYYPEITTVARLWCFGYDMDKMKARCWYESQMPVMGVNKELISGEQPPFITLVDIYINKAQFVLKALKDALKDILKAAKIDAKNVDSQFWLATEKEFFVQLAEVSSYGNLDNSLPQSLVKDWLRLLKRVSISIFKTQLDNIDVEKLSLKRADSQMENYKIIFSTLKKLEDKISENKLMSDFLIYTENS